jgi:hypothetical protein
VTHQIRIESYEWTIPAMENSRLSAGSRSNVRELEGNIAAANEDNSFRKLLQLEKLGAGG